MNRTHRLIAIASLAALGAFAAHADEADGSDRALSFTSTRSAADVRTEATMPVHITNGGTGFIGVNNSTVSREAVRAQAVSALRNGRIPSGEIGLM
ncbi:MAG: hypothetical protein NVS3B2_03560 [Ramlibacter sp.]